MVGRKLIERLAREGALGGRTVTELTAADVVEPEAVAACRDGPFPVRSAVGDFSAPGEAEKLLAGAPTSSFISPRSSRPRWRPDFDTEAAA